jgi:hypothetical protein
MRSRHWFGQSVCQAFLACILAVLTVAPVWAQTTTGTIRGQVTDESGQPVSSADVAATNAETGTQRRTLTSPTGQYVLPGLQPGTYNLAVTMLGYSALSTRTSRSRRRGRRIPVAVCSSG